MSTKVSNAHVHQKVRSWGLHYCLKHSFQPEDLEDETLAVLWKEGQRAMQRILHHLDETVLLREDDAN